MTPQISVVIPTYQRAEELGAFLFPSLQRQSCPPAEIMVVDDTEGDAVKNVCEGWTERFAATGIPLRYLKNPGPRSAARARNVGASRSVGDVLLFLDSDIELSLDYMMGITSILDEHGDVVGAQGFISNWADEPLARRFMEEYGRPGSLTHRVVSPLARTLLGAVVPSENSCRLFEYPIILDQPMECEWLSGSNLSMRKEAFEATRFETDMEGYSLGEDVLLSRRASAFGKLYITPNARCIHHWSPSGNPQRTRLGEKERLFLRRLYGFRGDIIYLNRRILFKLFGYHGTP
jgi:GT2 family glycosyltransferase